MGRRIIIWSVLITILAVAPAGAQESASQLRTAIDSMVHLRLAEDRTPGISVAVVRGTDTLVLSGYGLADVENHVPVTNESVFRIGSITKQFTAATVMRLVEQGRIELDNTIADYLPEYDGPGRVVTIHQLLNHTSGIPSYTSLGPEFWEKSRLDLTHAELLALFADDTLDFAPGSRWQYNNSGYYLLGMILEAVTDVSYDVLVDSLLFRPLGLVSTSYCRQRPIIPHRVQGYEVDAGELVNAEPISMNAPGAAGALCSTPRDLVRWTRALAGGDVVSDSSYARMTAPTRIGTGATQDYGYGLAPGKLGEHDVIAHGGGINGFTAFLAHYPDAQLTIAVLANGPTDTGALQTAIARRVLGVPEPPRAQLQDLPTTAEQRARYVGTYDLAPALPLQVRVFEQDGQLMAQATGQSSFPLRYQGADTFVGPDASGIRMVFHVEGDTAASFTLYQAGRAMEAKRVDSGS